MRAKVIFSIFSILFLLFLFVNLTSAATITPANVSDKELEEILKNDVADEVKISFWELPLWIKIHHIVTLCLTTLGLWKFLPILLTRIKSVLENRKRRRIMDAIVERPGISIKDLEELTGINRSTLRYHLDVLENEGLMISMRGRERLLFPKDYFSEQELGMLAALRSEARRKIMELIAQNGGMSARQIANVLNLNLKTVHHHLNSLGAAGVVNAKSGVFHLNNKAHMLLQKVGV